MDAESVDPRLLERSLRYIRAINGRLGYTRATVRHMDRLTAGWANGRVLRVLDVATGSADVPVAILKWADRIGRKVSIVGLDRHAKTIALASRSAVDPRIQLLTGDALALPFPPGAFDFVLSSMFLHHLPDPLAVDALREMNRVAATGVIVADLLRHRRALMWITLLTLAANPMVRHDARASVRGAFTLTEARSMADAAGLGFCQLTRHFGHRFVLAGVREPAAAAL